MAAGAVASIAGGALLAATKTCSGSECFGGHVDYRTFLPGMALLVGGVALLGVGLIRYGYEGRGHRCDDLLARYCGGEPDAACRESLERACSGGDSSACWALGKEVGAPAEPLSTPW